MTHTELSTLNQASRASGPYSWRAATPKPAEGRDAIREGAWTE